MISRLIYQEHRPGQGGSNQLELLRFKRPRGLKDLVVWFILMILENKHCDEEEKYWKVCLVCNKQTVTLPRHFVTPVNLWLCKDSVQPETAATACNNSFDSL